MKFTGLLLGLLILVGFYHGSQAASLSGLQYNPEDFVVAQPSCVHRLPLTRVNRLWRGKGIRSFTVLNNTKLVHDLNNDPSSAEHQEGYGYWEDDSIGRGEWRGGNVGDTRAAVTPFLAHRHFGESYKWMLYGDDDTLFYMTGVLKLLSHFDPEQPLALTDNIWFYAQHTNPGAPRCLPCGFNTSTIITNHTFTPRPACPFCTRALACGTYGPRYRCNATTHLAHMEAELGPGITNAGGGGDAKGATADATADAARFRAGMRRTAAGFSSWMDHHVALKARYPYEFRNKPAMDWEQREPGDWQQQAPTDGAAAENAAVENAAAAAADALSDDGIRRARRRRRRQRRRRRTLLSDGGPEDLNSDVGGSGYGGGGSGDSVGADLLYRKPEMGEEDLDFDFEEDQAELDLDPIADYNSQELDLKLDSGLYPEIWDEQPRQEQRVGPKDSQRRWRRLSERVLAGGSGVVRKRPVAQGYVDGSPWLSGALGRPLGGAEEDPERRALQLPYPFCARHDARLHGSPAPSCLLSVAGHGGSGIILSVGLMRLIETEEALRYVLSQRGCGGGDCLLGRLIWFRMGLGFTDPGTALQYGAQKYEKYCRFIDSNEQLVQIAALSNPSAMLQCRRRDIPRSKPCDRACVWLIENVVGLHVRAQNRQVNATVLEMLKRIESHRRAYDWIQRALQDPEVASGNVSVTRWVKYRYGKLTFPYISPSILEEYAYANAVLDRLASYIPIDGGDDANTGP